MPEINSFIIDTSDLSANKTGRQFSIKADVGSEFIVQVVNDDGDKLADGTFLLQCIRRAGGVENTELRQYGLKSLPP